VAVIFDLDGTLVDSREAFIWQNLDILRRYGLTDATIDDAVALLGQTPDKILEKITGTKRDFSEEVKAIDESYVNSYMRSYVKPFPGATECLKKLKKMGFKIGLATNTSPLILRECVEWFGMSDLVDAAVSAAEVGNEKPAPDVLMEVSKRLGVDPSQAIYVGDTNTDIVAAKRAGMASFATLQGGIGDQAKILSEKPDVIIPSATWVCRLLSWKETKWDTEGGESRRTVSPTPTFISTIPMLPIEMAKPVAVATWNFGLEGVKVASSVLKVNGSALDAVEQGIRAVESMGLRSVGISGLPNTEGVVELDASIMNGDKKAGAVAAVTGVTHPISLARKVMELTPHVLIVGDGARKFAKALGWDTEAKPPESTMEEWKKMRESALSSMPRPPDPWYWANPQNHDTVGLVAMDSAGHVAAGASTSGLAYKMPGRVGDTPLPGSGTYADDELGAAAATGIGEIAIRFALAHRAVELMADMPAVDAAEEALREIRRQEPQSTEISLVVIDSRGNWGGATLRGKFQYAAWDGDEARLLEVLSPPRSLVEFHA